MSSQTQITIRELHSGPTQDSEVFYWHRYCSPSPLSLPYTHTLTHQTTKPRKWRGA